MLQSNFTKGLRKAFRPLPWYFYEGLQSSIFGRDSEKRARRRREAQPPLEPLEARMLLSAAAVGNPVTQPNTASPENTLAAPVFDPSPFLNDAANYGLNITLPQDVPFSSWTTSNEPAAIVSLNLPLRDNVTYYSVDVSTGASASFGGISVSTNAGSTIAVVIDPADPCLFVDATPNSGPGIAFGFSNKGLIPFVAAANNYTGPHFSGQIWGQVQNVELGKLPLSATGDVTIRLNGFSFGHDASTLFTTAGLTVAENNVSIGVNGTLSLGVGGDFASLGIPLASASLGYTPANLANPNNIQFACSTDSHPFAGTPLAGYFSGGQFAIKGGSSWSNRSDAATNMYVDLTSRMGATINVDGYKIGTPTTTFGLHVTSSDVKLNASIGTPIGSAKITGGIDPITGGFDLTGRFDNHIFGNSSMTLAYHWAGLQDGLTAAIDMSFNKSWGAQIHGIGGSVSVDGSVTGTIFIGTNGSLQSHLNAHGYGHVSASALFVHIHESESFSESVSLTNHSFSISFDVFGYHETLTINF